MFAPTVAGLIAHSQISILGPLFGTAIVIRNWMIMNLKTVNLQKLDEDKAEFKRWMWSVVALIVTTAIWAVCVTYHLP
jgi:hypothetical protein